MINLNDLPKTRKEAKALGEKFYYTGKKCKYGHVDKRYTSNSRCFECHKESTRKYYTENSEIIAVKSKKLLKENPEIVAARNRKYAKNNPAKINAKSARRRAIKKAARPDNADQTKMNWFYEASSELNKLYGSTLCVDHIIPLDNGGLDHEYNFQLLTQSLNCSKGAKLDWVHPYQIDEMHLTDPTIIKWLATFS